MSTATVNLSSFDVQRLEPLVARNGATAGRPAHLDLLRTKISTCIEVPPMGVPPFVVTMNSQVRLLDLETGKEVICTLVFPLQADATEGRISVLAPLGALLLGSRMGTVIDVPTPLGVRRYRIDEILFQPESAGKYDL